MNIKLPATLSSMRWRKGVMGRCIFMGRLLALREMTSWTWCCGHAIDAGVIVRWTGWDNEQDARHQGRSGKGFFYSESVSCLVRSCSCRARHEHDFARYPCVENSYPSFRRLVWVVVHQGIGVRSRVA